MRRDIAGAMLRKSFSRRPNKSLFWPPARAVAAAFLTAGLWPSGLLIYRLWQYATHQRFRAGELARWVRAPDQPAFQIDTGSMTVRDVHWTQIIPQPTLVLALAFWLAGIAFVVLSALHQIFDFEFLRSRIVSLRLTFLFFIAVGAACMMQLATVFSLRERIESCFKRSDMRFRRGCHLVSRPDLPLWSLWPSLLALSSIPAKLAGFQFAAMWIVAATAAVLASEIQRGYISVADRRMRLNVARAIGAVLYSEARR